MRSIVLAEGVRDGLFHGVDLIENLLVEREAGGLEAFVEVLHARGANDGRGDEVVLFAPGDCHGGEAHAGILGNGLQPGGGFEAASIDEAGRHSLLPFVPMFQIGGESPAFRILLIEVLPGENASRQGRVGEEGDLFLTADLGQLALAAAIDETEIVLHRLVAAQTVDVGGPEALHETPRGFVAASEGASFALVNEFGEGLEDLLIAHPVIWPVGLIEDRCGPSAIS